MARGLYRAYLYAISIALMILIAVGTGRLLGDALALNPQLRGPYAFTPSHDDVALAAAFAIVAWIVGGGLLGLHYWLIRRDIASEPSAANGPVRAFFLNGAEAFSVLTFVTACAAILSGLGQSNQGDLSGVLTAAIVSLALALAFEFERRRARPAPRAALVFQRIHLYGVPLILLFVAALSYGIQAVQQTIVSVLLSSGNLPNECPPGYFGNCGGPSPAGLWAAAAFVSGMWGVYWLLARGDTRTILGRVVHLIGLAFGVIMTVVGIARGAELGLRALLGISVSSDDFAFNYSFVPPLVVGVVVLAAYGLRLRTEATRLPAEASAIWILAAAISAGLTAVPFWIGCGGLLHALVEGIVGNSAESSAAVWANAGSLVVAGLAYLILSVLLGSESARTGIGGPRRALAFTLLALGTLTAAVGAVVALYTLVSELLGVAVPNGPETARSGLVALVIGLVVVGLYLRIILSERGRGKPPTPAPEPVAVQASPPSAGLPA